MRTYVPQQGCPWRLGYSTVLYTYHGVALDSYAAKMLGRLRVAARTGGCTYKRRWPVQLSVVLSRKALLRSFIQNVPYMYSTHVYAIH